MDARSVGPYRILRLLGAGGMGEVFLAEDTRLKRRVALKSLSADWARKPDAQRRLLHEARAAAALNHPNIAAIYDILQAEDAAYIVMEYVAGETLSDRLNAGPLAPAAVAWIGVQLCEALAEAHAHGVIHRDLKPGNLILTPDGRLKVLDFGVAKTLVLDPSYPTGPQAPSSPALEHSQGGRRLVGTPPYLPPEHVLGAPVDERSDLYSAGVVLYELLTGRRPFVGASTPALVAAILNDTPAMPRELNPSVPVGLERVVLRAMARDPAERYPSAAAMKADLARARAAEAGTTLGEETRLKPKPLLDIVAGRRSLATAVVALSVVVGTSLYLISKGVRPSDAPPGAPVLAVLPLTSAHAGSEDESLTIGMVDMLIASLTRIKGLNVVSRSATLGALKEVQQDTSRVPRFLGVDFTLDCAVQRSADRVRLVLSLVRADSSVVVWSEVYDGALGDLMGLETRVAEAVPRALRLRLSPGDRRRIEETPTPSPEALADYTQAVTFLERPDDAENIDRALGLFQAAIDKDAAFARAHAGLGRARWAKYVKTKDAAWTAKARDAIESALELDGDQPDVRYALAVLYRGTGRREDAVLELKRVLELQPASDEAHVLLGKILIDQGKVEDGLAELRRAVDLRPNFWMNYYDLGVASLRLGRNEEAVARLRRVTELQPDSAWGHHALGAVYLAMGDYTQAIASSERSLRVRENAGAWSNLGMAHYAQGRFREALEAFRHAVQLEPRQALGYRNLGDTYSHLGATGQAREAYLKAEELTREALRVNPQNAMSRAQLAVYQAKLGRHADAEREIAAAAALAPGSGDVLFRKAVVLALGGKTDESLRAVEAALAHGYSVSLVREDEDLARLKQRPEFAAILAAASSSRRSE